MLAGVTFGKRSDFRQRHKNRIKMACVWIQWSIDAQSVGS